jgi:hypothetical protein
VIQEETGGTYRQVWQGFTADTFIEVSLSPGSYRFRVIPYDLFNLPSQASAWVLFVIRPALAPEIESFRPQSFIIQQDQTEYELNIRGRNISHGASIFLRRPGTTLTTEPIQTTITPDGNSATLLFTRDQLEQGIFLLHIINTSGLEKSMGDFVIELPVIQQEDDVIEIPQTDTGTTYSLNVFLGLSWTPLYEIPQFNQQSDQQQSDQQHYDQQSSDQQHPDGATLRFGLISSNSNTFNIGFELSAAYYFFGLLLLENNFLVRTHFRSQRFFIFFRLGAGFILPVGEQTAPTQLDTKIVYANAGISFCYALFRNFYIEAGINYSYKFAVENHFSLLKPMLGIGVKW